MTDRSQSNDKMDQVLKELQRLRQLEEQRQARAEAIEEQRRYEEESRCIRSSSGYHEWDFEDIPGQRKTRKFCKHCRKLLGISSW
jgi:putative SOS response-associated peptidase YedK